jgi:hypothetical protein
MAPRGWWAPFTETGAGFAAAGRKIGRDAKLNPANPGFDLHFCS